METLRKYKRELIAGAGAAIVGWFLYKATSKQDDQGGDDQYVDEIDDIKIKMDGKLYSKETLLAVYKKLHSKNMEKTMKLIMNSRKSNNRFQFYPKERRQHKKNIQQYIQIVMEALNKRDAIIEKSNIEGLKEMGLDPMVWHKSLEFFHEKNEKDEDFNKKLSDIIATYPENFDYKIIQLSELDQVLDFMINAAENEDNDFVKEMVQLSSFDSGLGIEVFEARIYDRVFEKYKYEEDDIQVSLKNIQTDHEIHKKFEVFMDLVDEITSGFKDYDNREDEEDPAYVDGPDNEEDYEDVSDEEN